MTNHIFLILMNRKVYVDFNEGLKALTKEKRLTEYPNLCAAATSKFYVLSHQINKIKVTSSVLWTSDILPKEVFDLETRCINLRFLSHGLLEVFTSPSHLLSIL